MYFGVVTSDKIFFSRINTSSLSCIQRFFSKMKMVKTLLRTQLKQTNLENRLHISTKIPKEGFNDTIFQHFVNKLKNCNSDIRMELQILVPVFLCLCSIYLVDMLSSRIIFFHNLFCFISFPCKFAIFWSLKVYLQFLMKIFRNKLFALVLFNIIQDFLDYI